MSLKEIERNLSAYIRDMHNDVAGEALDDIGLDFIGTSSARAPKETGDLRGSGYVTTPNTTLLVTDGNGEPHRVGRERIWGKQPVIEAGWTVPYAPVQHERTDYRHVNGEAKFAEKTLQEKANVYRDHLANASRRYHRE